MSTSTTLDSRRATCSVCGSTGYHVDTTAGEIVAHGSVVAAAPRTRAWLLADAAARSGSTDSLLCERCDELLDAPDLAYQILRAYGPHCSDGADPEAVALAERATDGQGVRSYGAESAGLSDDRQAIVECVRMLRAVELSEED